MSTHKYVDRICLVIILVILGGAALFLWQYIETKTEPVGKTQLYETGLFDTSAVHTIDITMEDWDGFLETCEDEQYTVCTVTIDGETLENTGIRAKGNTSLSMVKSYGNNRYSFKLEFDHYQEGGNFQGLDKLSLNNIIQDNTYQKDYLCYQLMGYFGVDAPLCSYAYLTVNGQDWGLYLAVEGVEESFLERNYGGGQGELYKPDSMDMGGGPGVGENFQMPEDFDPTVLGLPEDFDMETFDPSQIDFSQIDFSQIDPRDFFADNAASDTEQGDTARAPADREGGQMPEEVPGMPSGAENEEGPGGPGGGPEGFTMGSDDVKLIYTDDDFSSYENIFDNAKTDITDQDKRRLIASLKTLNEGTDIEAVVDVDEVIRYFVVHNFVCNFDSYTGSMIHNYYLYEEDGVLSMIPWDYNLAFGGFQAMGDATELVNYPVDDPVSGGTTEDRPMLAWIFADETYTNQYHQYFAEFVTYFTSGDFAAEYERVAQMIAPYVEKDPTKFCTYEEFEMGAQTLKDFCLLRAQSIQGQLNGTIPADSAGQATQTETLVDASHLTISDMGSMMGSMANPAMGMGGGPGAPNDGAPGEAPTDAPSSDREEGEAAVRQTEPPGTPPDRPNDAQEPGKVPDEPQKDD